MFHPYFATRPGPAFPGMYQQPRHVHQNHGAMMQPAGNGRLLHPGEFGDGGPDFPVYENDAVGDYRVQKFLGSGSFSKVLQCRHKTTGEVVAIKVSKLGEGNQEEIQNELRILQALRQLDPTSAYKWLPPIDSFQFNGLTCIVFPLCGSSVFDEFEKRQFAAYSVDRVRTIARDLLTALAFCHGKGIIHGDVKPDNMLLRTADEDSEVHLVDFGSALYDWEEKRELGTVHYQSPEMMFAGDFSFKHDVFSAGLVLLELYCGRCLMGPDADENVVLIQALLGAMPVHVSGRVLPQAPGHAASRGIRALERMVRVEDADFLDFIRKALTYDCHQRASAYDLLHHPFLGTGLPKQRRHSYNVKSERQSSLNSSNASAPADLGSLDDSIDVAEAEPINVQAETVQDDTPVMTTTTVASSPKSDTSDKREGSDGKKKTKKYKPLVTKTTIKPEVRLVKFARSPKGNQGSDRVHKAKSSWAKSVRKVSSTPYGPKKVTSTSSTSALGKDAPKKAGKKSLATRSTGYDQSAAPTPHDDENQDATQTRQPVFNPTKEVPPSPKAKTNVTRVASPVKSPAMRTVSASATSVHPWTRKFFEGENATNIPIVHHHVTKSQSQTAVTPAVRSYVRDHPEAMPLAPVWRQHGGKWVRARRRRNFTH